MVTEPVIANSLISGAVVGILFLSFGLSAMSIFLITFLVARYEADLESKLIILTAFLLFALELSINIFWSETWEDGPGNLQLLGSVFVPVALLGIRLLYKFHYTGVLKSVFIMWIYVSVKISFAIFVATGVIAELGTFAPTPLTVWIQKEDWKLRDVENLKMELPGPPAPRRIAPPRGWKNLGKIQYFSQIDFGGCQVQIVEVIAMRPEFNLDRSVEDLLTAFSPLPPTENSVDSDLPAMVDGFPARRVRTRSSAKGKSYASEMLIFTAGDTCWAIQVAGREDLTKDRADRILPSVQFRYRQLPADITRMRPASPASKDREMGRKNGEMGREEIEIKVAGIVRIADSDTFPVAKKLIIHTSIAHTTTGELNPTVDILGRTTHQVIISHRGPNRRQLLREIDLYIDEHQNFIRNLPVTHQLGSFIPGLEPDPFPVKHTIVNAEGVVLDVTIIGRTTDTVIFKKRNGEEFRYPIEALSPSSKRFVRGLPISE